jgi:hypothetical protein
LSSRRRIEINTARSRYVASLLLDQLLGKTERPYGESRRGLGDKPEVLYNNSRPPSGGSLTPMIY